MTRTSVWLSKRCVAKLCLRVCGEIQVPRPATSAAIWQARFSCRVDAGGAAAHERRNRGRPELAHQLTRVHYPRKLARVLSPEDVARLLEAAPGPGLKYKAALSVAYGAGLRAMEVVALKVSDIDSKRMLIRVEQGKGRKDRHAMLSPQLLEVLRAWWLQCRSKGWLFPGRDPFLPVTAASSWICWRGAPVAKAKSKASSVLIAGKPAVRVSISRDLARLASRSALRTSSRKSA